MTELVFVGRCFDPLLNWPTRVFLDGLGLHENVRIPYSCPGGPGNLDRLGILTEDIKSAVHKIGLTRILLMGHNPCRAGVTLEMLIRSGLHVREHFGGFATVELHWFDQTHCVWGQYDWKSESLLF